MNKFCATKMTSARVWVIWWAWHTVPCTLAVVAGPIIATIYSLSRPEYSKDGSFSISQALNGTLCLMMFLSLFLSRRLHLLKLQIIRPIIFLSVYAGMTCFLSQYPYENIAFSLKLVFLALIFASAFHLAQSKLCSENWLAGCASVILTFMAVSQVIGYVTGNTIAYYSDYATAGIISLGSVTATFIVATLPVFLRFFPDRKWSLVGIIIAISSLFFTMRRTELISAICAIIIVIMYNINPFRQNKLSRGVILAVLILSVLTTIGLSSPAGSDLLARMSDLNPSEGTGSGRYIFWRISLDHILNRGICEQVMGEGMGSIRNVLYKNFGLEIGSHTAWLDITYAFGLFGLIVLLWWYFRLVQLAKYMNDNKNAAFQGVFSAVIIMFLLSIGQGGFNEPSLALIYAALGYWMGQTFDYRRRQVIYARSDLY